LLDSPDAELRIDLDQERGHTEPVGARICRTSGE
jgi:hypothetical protein